ncbi:MAG TPA: sialidase family protein [Rhodanobacteraceae bacterium]|nr:sialidase family protein [Rhodanobacteraceae bacterium]
MLRVRRIRRATHKLKSVAERRFFVENRTMTIFRKFFRCFSPAAWIASLAMLAMFMVTSLPALAQSRSHAPPKTTTPPPLQFHYMGPPAGGRIASVAGIPGNDSTYYLGAASGGLWKSTDGGHTFLPIFDDQDTAAIGAIAVARSDSNTVWVGTGEPWFIRPSDIWGDGVYKSTDAGKTWQHMGLVNTGRIARIIINPGNPNNVLVCAEGRGNGPQQERGVYRTTDGGKTWKRTLFVNAHTGCSGLSMDPANPDTVLAGTWQVTGRTWAEDSGGPGSGVHISHDNGRTWKHLTRGLPTPPLGKIDVSIAPSNPQRMYALIQTRDQGSVWRSDDGGSSWKVVSHDRNLIMRAGYYIFIEANPKDANGVLVLNSGDHYSSDGGLTFSGEGGKKVKSFGPASCGDCHDGWIDPTDPAHYVLTDDGGAQIATGAGTALTVALPNGQIYHIASDNQVPYWIYGNRQDDGAWRLSSDISQPGGNGLLPASEFMPQGKSFDGFYSGRRGKTKINKELLARYPKAAPPPKGWALGPNGEPQNPPGRSGFEGPNEQLPTYQYFPNACESGFTIPDPEDSGIVWSSCYANNLYRFDLTQGTPHAVSPSQIALDSPPNQTKYRCHWTPPLAIDPFDPRNVYFGCQMVLRTSDAGHSWIEFSPDLSTRDPSRIVPSGGIMQDNLGQYYGEVVWSMAFSPIVKGLLWAGTNDGKLWYTKDAESQQAPQWIDVTANLQLPPWGDINQIAPSHFHAGTVYIAVDFRWAGEGNDKPYILMTTDYGKTWKNIDGDLPSNNPLDYTLSIAENPNREGMLFAGTGHAFYYTLDSGKHWVHFNKGLPPSPVTWINIEPRMHDVDVSTYGRGDYILPDIATLEQTGSMQQPAGGTTRLFKPGPVFRKARSAYPTAAEPARPQFQFYLASAPGKPVQLQILDARGKVIRTEKLDAHKGLNGAYWDLFHDMPTDVKLRTTPPENPYIWDEPRYQGKKYRTIIHWGVTPHTGTPIAAPGDYQVRLTVDGKPYVQPFRVLKDPKIAASDAVLRDSTALQVQIADAITRTSDMVNAMEEWRRQIQDQLKTHASGPTASALAQLNVQILAVENQLIGPEARVSDDKQYSTRYKVYWNLRWLGGQVGQGAQNAAGGSDYEPTMVQRQTFAKLQGQIVQAQAGFENLESGVLPAFNNRMKNAGVTINPGG